MSMKSELQERGVKLSSLAKELEEAYGNLYTALQMEEAGKEVRHKAVQARIQKVRDWLDQSHADEARVASSVEAVGNRAAMAKRYGAVPNHPGWNITLAAKAGERAVECGDVLTLMEEGEAKRYRFLRVVQTAVSTWADVFGPLPVKETSWTPHMRSRPLTALGLELSS